MNIMFHQKNKEYFERILETQDKQIRQFEKKIMKVSDEAQIASYKIAELVVLKLKPHTISLHVGESNDISKNAQILCFVRFIYELQILNQLLCCNELLEHSDGQELFNALSLYLNTLELSWDQRVDICIDRAASI